MVENWDKLEEHLEPAFQNFEERRQDSVVPQEYPLKCSRVLIDVSRNEFSRPETHGDFSDTHQTPWEHAVN